MRYTYLVKAAKRLLATSEKYPTPEEARTAGEEAATERGIALESITVEVLAGK